MLIPPSGPEDATLEQCIDELDQCVGSLQHYPEAVLAFALRMHLSALLRAMVDCHTCTRQEVRAFLVELEQEALGVGE